MCRSCTPCCRRSSADRTPEAARSKASPRCAESVPRAYRVPCTASPPAFFAPPSPQRAASAPYDTAPAAYQTVRQLPFLRPAHPPSSFQMPVCPLSRLPRDHGLHTSSSPLRCRYPGTHPSSDMPSERAASCAPPHSHAGLMKSRNGAYYILIFLPVPENPARFCLPSSSSYRFLFSQRSSS